MKRFATALVLLVSLALLGPAPASADGPPRVLILEDTVAFWKAQNEVTLAKDLGFEVRVASAEKWASLTTEDFARYDALIVGDPSCGYYEQIEVLEETRVAWSAAVTGNVVIAGNDPVFHQRKGDAMLFHSNAIAWAASGDTTGLYFSLSCYFSYFKKKPIRHLKDIGLFQVQGQGRPPVPGCPDRVRVTKPLHPVMAGVTSEGLSDWRCSIHETLPEFPASFRKLAGERHSHYAAVIAGPGIVPVTVDVDPGGSGDVTLGVGDTVDVAILGSGDYIPADIDALHVCFGDEGDATQRQCSAEGFTGTLTDVNGDGFADFVQTFDVDSTGVDVGDGAACIRARSTSGWVVGGCDAISVGTP